MNVRLLFVDAGTLAVEPGQHVDVQIGSAVRQAVVVIAPEQFLLAEVVPQGHIVRVPTMPESLPVANVMVIDPADARVVTAPIWAEDCVGELPGSQLTTLGTRIITELGPGTVIRLDVPRGRTTVQLDSGQVVETEVERTSE